MDMKVAQTHCADGTGGMLRQFYRMMKIFVTFHIASCGGMTLVDFNVLTNSAVLIKCVHA